MKPLPEPRVVLHVRVRPSAVRAYLAAGIVPNECVTDLARAMESQDREARNGQGMLALDA